MGERRIHIEDNPEGLRWVFNPPSYEKMMVGAGRQARTPSKLARGVEKEKGMGRLEEIQKDLSQLKGKTHAGIE